MNLKWPFLRSLQPKQRESMIECIAGKRTLGLFTLLLIMAIPAAGYALCDATLKWGNGNDQIEGYYVFGREEGQDYDYDEPWWQGDATFGECTIDELEEDKTYFFVIRVFAGDNVSADSNEVRFSFYDSTSESSGSESSGSESSESESSESDSLVSDSSASSTLSNDATSNPTVSSFHGSSGACFIRSLLDSE
jgi:hypothetical protein